jgi:hypothetical protein
MTENQEPENNGNKGTGNDNKRIQGGHIPGNFPGNYQNLGHFIERIVSQITNIFSKNKIVIVERQGDNETST